MQAIAAITGRLGRGVKLYRVSSGGYMHHSDFSAQAFRSHRLLLSPYFTRKMGSALYAGLILLLVLVSVFLFSSSCGRWRLRSVQGDSPYQELPFWSGSESTITVIGAGVIGLCTAYQLSQTRNTHRIAGKIIVIDTAATAFHATSQTNTGILSCSGSGFNDKLLPLAQDSYAIWEQLGRSQFKDFCGYKECSNYSVSAGTGRGSALLPSWFHFEKCWDTLKEPSNNKAAIM